MLKTVIAAAKALVAPRTTLAELRAQLTKGLADFEALRKTHQESAADAAELRYQRRRGEKVSDDGIKRLEAASEEAGREMKICEVVNEDLAREVEKASTEENKKELAELKAARGARAKSEAAARLKASHALLDFAEASLDLNGDTDVVSGVHIRRGAKFDVPGFVAGLCRVLHSQIDEGVLAETVPVRFGAEALRKYKHEFNARKAEDARLQELDALLNPPSSGKRIVINRTEGPYKVKCRNPPCDCREAFLSADKRHAECMACRLIFPTPQTYFDEVEKNAAPRRLPVGQHPVAPNLDKDGRPLLTGGRPKDVPDALVKA